ncbi:MAG: flagellar hook-length control protein FliK [Acidobacteriaceae bacterium]|nr:flagellar hook-length control protein FliK [Acidobacteriaceae bacterium]MBV9498314.1 flagellar hook-length control protein FliK [Acidobacteriaceae bacterium]
MRIQKASPEGRQEITNAKGNADKNDRFSKILDERRKESMPQFNLPGEGQGSELPPTIRQPESISSAPASTDIERLASEIVDNISSHEAGGARSVEIQFNSQTLEGLRVSVQTLQGSITVSFLSPVSRVAGLVQRNLGSLRSALESKGIRVAQLAVSRWTG